MIEAETKKFNNAAFAGRHRVLQVLLVLLVTLSGTVATVHRAPVAFWRASSDDLRNQVLGLTEDVKRLRQEQSMPALVLNRYRNSIGYVYGVYHVGFENQRPKIRARVSGTGFLVGNHLVATNRHIAEPWYRDSEAEKLIRSGAIPVVESLVIFFPGFTMPIRLSRASVSKTSDIAVLQAEDTEGLRLLPILPLSTSTGPVGQFVDVIGYPMGMAGMLAKSPAAINELLAYQRSDIIAARGLAAKSLIRPLSTCGHLADVIGDTLIYDAATAHGGSGGPVFNAYGEVIGVNSAYIDGFSGASIGVSIESVRPLLPEVQPPTKVHLHP
jgi:S1-C subfamily serine protease